MDGKKSLKIFMMPQEFPCGENSSCCGPIGQSEEEIHNLKNSIEKELGYEVEVLNVKSEDDMKDYPRIAQLLHSFGPTALPILMLEDDVVSMGNNTPEKTIAAILEKIEDKKIGKENEMLENDNSGKAEQESSDKSNTCYPSASVGGGCCSPASSKNQNWKMLVFIFIVVIAGLVLARSIIRKSDSVTEQGQSTFASVQPDIRLNTPSQLSAEAKTKDATSEKGDAETSVVTNEKIKEDVSIKVSPELWGPELDSLASLNKVASDFDAVFILLTANNQESSQAAAKEIEAAARTVQSGGVRISAFRLSQGAPNYVNLTNQLSTPSVLAMVKGGGLSGVPAGQINESKLVQAYVAASRPSSGCCPPGSGATCP